MSNLITFGEEDIPKNLNPEDRKKVLALISDESKVKIDARAMLEDVASKKITTTDRIRTMYAKNKFSPIAKLMRLCEIEEAKMEAWNRAVMLGLDPALMDFMPKPDKNLLAKMLIQLARYEGPELRSVEMTGEISAGITVTLQRHQPQQRLIKVDSKSPEKLRLLHGSVPELTEKAKEVAVEIVEGEDY